MPAAPVRIGLVDLDTSHPAAFTRILSSIPGVEVSAVWDGGDVWPEGYVRAFAREHGVQTVCPTLEEMPGHVDAAMILGVNWDAHVRKAQVFLQAGKPVLIDKPVVGSVRDGDRLLNLQEKHGTLVFGGSSLRWAKEVTALREAVGPRDDIHSIVASGPGDFFSYGIHTTEMLQGLAGIGIRSVQVMTAGGKPVIRATYHDGLVALLQLEMRFHEWSLCAYTRQGLRVATIAVDGLYEPFLKTFVHLLHGGKVDDPLTGPVEAVRVHLAADRARSTGREVLLGDLSPDAAFDGRAFALEYASTKRPQAQDGGGQ